MADGRVIIDVDVNEKGAVRGVDNVNKRLGMIVSGGRRAAAGIRDMVTALGLAAAGAKALQMVNNALDGAIDRYDTLTGFPVVMQQLGFSAEESQKAIKRLSDGVQGLPTTLDSVAKTAQRIASMTGDLNGAVEITLALNNAFIASGSSVADAERGLEQFLQMLATGKVDMQSWRTLQETMGVALNDLAKSFGFAGKSAQTQLYEALKSGKITFDEFTQRLIELSNQTGGFADRARTATSGIRTAWTNMNTAIVRGVTEIIAAIDAVLKDTPLESIQNIIENMGKAFFNALNSVAQFIQGLKGQVGEVRSIGDLIQGIFTAIANNIPAMIQNIVTRFVENYPRMYEQGLNILLKVIEGFTAAVPALLETAMNVIPQIVQALLGMLPLIIEAGITLIMTLLQGIISMLPQLIQMGSEILVKVVDGIVAALPQLVDMAVKLVFTLVDTLLANLPKILEAGIDLLNALVKGIISNLPTLIQAAIELVVKLVAAIIKLLPRLIQTGVELVLSLISGMIKTLPNLMSNTTKIIDSIFKAFGKVNWSSIGKDIVSGLLKGLASTASSVYRKAAEIANTVKSKIESALRIASPSKVMIELGKFTGEGLVVGMDKTIRAITQKAQAMADAALPEIRPASVPPLAASVAGGAAGGGIGDIIITGNNFHIREEADINRISRAMMRQAIEYQRGPGRRF